MPTITTTLLKQLQSEINGTDFPRQFGYRLITHAQTVPSPQRCCKKKRPKPISLSPSENQKYQLFKFTLHSLCLDYRLTAQHPDGHAHFQRLNTFFQTLFYQIDIYFTQQRALKLDSLRNSRHPTPPHSPLNENSTVKPLHRLKRLEQLQPSLFQQYQQYQTSLWHILLRCEALFWRSQIPGLLRQSLLSLPSTTRFKLNLTGIINISKLSTLEQLDATLSDLDVTQLQTKIQTLLSQCRWSDNPLKTQAGTLSPAIDLNFPLKKLSIILSQLTPEFRPLSPPLNIQTLLTRIQKKLLSLPDNCIPATDADNCMPADLFVHNNITPHSIACDIEFLNASVHLLPPTPQHNPAIQLHTIQQGIQKLTRLPAFRSPLHQHTLQQLLLDITLFQYEKWSDFTAQPQSFETTKHRPKNLNSLSRLKIHKKQLVFGFAGLLFSLLCYRLTLPQLGCFIAFFVITRCVHTQLIGNNRLLPKKVIKASPLPHGCAPSTLTK